MATAESRPAAYIPSAGDAFPEFPAPLTTNKRKTEEIVADLKSMKPPEFIHPYPSSVNRHKSKAVATCIAWFHEQSLETLFPDPVKLQLFLRSKIHDLAPVVYVDAEEEELSWLCSFTLWLYLLDDVLDDLSPQNAAPIVMEINLVMMWSFPDNPVFHNTFAELITVLFPAEQRQAIFDNVDAKLAEARLQSGSVYDTSNLGLLVSSFNDLWVRLLASAPLDSVIRWGNSIQKYLIGNIMEAKNRNADRVPLLKEYISLRRRSTGLEPCVWITEFAYKLSTSLPAELFDSPQMTMFVDALNDIIGFHNDIYSLKKEVLGSGYVIHNLVYIISHTRGCSLSDARAIALDMLHTRLEDFDRAIADLKTISTPASQEVVSAYVRNAQFWVSGTHDFHVQSERYSWR